MARAERRQAQAAEVRRLGLIGHIRQQQQDADYRATGKRISEELFVGVKDPREAARRFQARRPLRVG